VHLLAYSLVYEALGHIGAITADVTSGKPDS